MLGQIDGVEMACNICEIPERSTCAHEANWSASFTDYWSEHQSSIEVAVSQKTAVKKFIETDVSDPE